MIGALLAVVMFVFDASPSLDVVAYPCTVWARTMVPAPETSCVDPPCRRISDPVPVVCTVAASLVYGTDFESHIPSLPLGTVAYGYVQAQDASGNRSEALGWSDAPGALLPVFWMVMP